MLVNLYSTIVLLFALFEFFPVIIKVLYIMNGIEFQIPFYPGTMVLPIQNIRLSSLYPHELKVTCLIAKSFE